MATYKRLDETGLSLLWTKVKGYVYTQIMNAFQSLAFRAPDGIAWSTLGSNWSPSVSGVATVRINPSNSSSCYIQITDTSNGGIIVAQIATTGGMAASTAFPVVGGHTYKVNAKSNNISVFQVYLYTFTTS